MKNLFTCLFLSIIYLTPVKAQDFDIGLEKIAEGISKKIDSKGKTKVAVWGFFTESGEATALGNYITEDFSVYLTNSGENFQVIDRNHLDVLLKEHQLNSEGYIDGATAKELGKITAVDAIITGTYTVLNSVVKVRAKVLDTETALQFAANMGSLPLNENISSYLGISIKGGNTTNKGFNRPLGSNETVNNPETVDSECSKKSAGDFCFNNSLNEKVILRIKYFVYPDTKNSSINYKTLILDSGESKCIYSIANRPFSYFVAKWADFVDVEKLDGAERYLVRESHSKFLKDKGELKVETCKSKTYTIK